MAKEEYAIDDFLAQVQPEFRGFVSNLDSFLLRSGCNGEIKLKASGYFARYTHLATKRVMANMLFRKNRMQIRIYGDNIAKYEPFLTGIPEAMTKAIDKAPHCKRYIDPKNCNPSCSMGYAFKLGEKQYYKCKYSAFVFDVCQENNPHIMEFLKAEAEKRA